jgi:hypothetical protein
MPSQYLLDTDIKPISNGNSYAKRPGPPENLDRKTAWPALERGREHYDLSARGSDGQDSTREPEFVALALEILKFKTGRKRPRWAADLVFSYSRWSVRKP